MSGKAYFHKKARIKTTPSAKKVIKESIERWNKQA